MGTFTKIQGKLEVIFIELREISRLVEQCRKQFKNTPQEEIEQMRQRLNQIEARF